MATQEIEQQRGLYNDGTHLIQVHIRPDDRVLEVGPGAIYGPNRRVLPMDMGGVFGVGHQLVSGIGALTILGPSKVDNITHEGGLNDMSGLTATLEEIQENVPGMLSQITSVESLIQDYQPEGKKFDVIWDHLTFFNWLISPTTNYGADLRRIVTTVDHYLDLIADNGKIILFYKRTPYLAETVEVFQSAAETYNYSINIEQAEVLNEKYVEPKKLIPHIRTHYPWWNDRIQNDVLHPAYHAGRVIIIQKQPQVA